MGPDRLGAAPSADGCGRWKGAVGVSVDQATHELYADGEWQSIPEPQDVVVRVAARPLDVVVWAFHARAGSIHAPGPFVHGRVAVVHECQVGCPRVVGEMISNDCTVCGGGVARGRDGAGFCHLVVGRKNGNSPAVD